MNDVKTRPMSDECVEKEPSQIDEQLNRYDSNIDRLDRLVESTENKLGKILHEDQTDKEGACGTVKPSELVSLAFNIEELNDRFQRRLERLNNILNRIEL